MLFEHMNHEGYYTLFRQKLFIPETVVGGWLEDREAFLLYLMGMECTMVNAPGVELGTFRGRSALHFCKGSDSKVPLYCVDSWDYPEGCGLDTKTYENYFTVHCKDQIEVGAIIPVKSDTAKAAELFADESIHGIFIDADHSTAGLTKDFQAWLPKVRKDGLVIFHDYGACAWPDVQPVVDSFIASGAVRRIGRQVTALATRKN